MKTMICFVVIITSFVFVGCTPRPHNNKASFLSGAVVVDIDQRGVYDNAITFTFYKKGVYEIEFSITTGGI